MSQYFYDGQIRRFLLQFARMVSNFEVEGGIDDDGNVTLIRVPVRYGDASRQAQTILQDNSRNSIPCAPTMSFYIDSLTYDRNRMQEPNFVDRRQVKQRTWDETSQEYETTQGNAFMVERPMPVPYKMTIKLDMWTSNTHMKFQLWEQIATLFNPALEIQSTDNYLDWTSLSVVELESETWSSRTIPNNDDAIDIATFKFNIPIWISPPARVTKEGVIHKIIASIYDDAGNYNDAIDGDNILLGTRVKITPHGYQILLLGNELRILPKSAPGDSGAIDSIPDPSTSVSWRAVIDEYGALNDGISQIRLESASASDIIGTISYHPSDASVLLFSVDTDTLPGSTLDPVDAVINPLESGPISAGTGTRYLLTDDIGDPEAENADAWGTVVANANDIIEYNGAKWVVAFDSSGTDPEYVTNITTGVQFKFVDGNWVRSYEGIYNGGNWNIVL
jgi:hypothetical protein